jgi:four helix bundle suffix protein
MEKTYAGYEYLIAYKITVPIYDLTVEFCDKWVSKYSRTTDQMTQAGRSGMTNIPEGYKQESLKSYLKLAGVAGGSVEELMRDYESFIRQNHLEFYPPEKVKREIRELREIWDILDKNKTLPQSPNFPHLPSDKEKAANLMLTLCKQASYLIERLVKSLEQKFIKEGGFSENLLKKRMNERKK